MEPVCQMGVQVSLPCWCVHFASQGHLSSSPLEVAREKVPSEVTREVLASGLQQVSPMAGKDTSVLFLPQEVVQVSEVGKEEKGQGDLSEPMVCSSRDGQGGPIITFLLRLRQQLQWWLSHAHPEVVRLIPDGGNPSGHAQVCPCMRRQGVWNNSNWP